MTIFSSAELFAALLLAGATPAQQQLPAPYSDAVRNGDTLYLAGAVGTDPASHALVPGGFEAEAKQALENIGATLAKHGLTHADLVKCTVLLADIADWGKFNGIYRGYFPTGKFPARTAYAVAGLPFGAKVEIDCIARFATAAR